MPDAREYTSVVAAAENAANAGDLAGAEALLRQALQMQEARVGPVHADLVNPLNNLAVVCEARGNLREAERHFRRAYGVARTALPAADPRVATSLQNLRDFCRIQGIAFESTPPVATARPATPPAHQPQPRVPRGLVIALAVAALAGTALVARLWLRSEASTPTTVAPAAAAAKEPGPASAVPSTAGDAPPTSGAPPAESPAAATGAGTAVAPSSTPATPAPPAPVEVVPPATPPVATGNDVRVVTAQVCQALDTMGEWTCTPLASPAAAGRAAFYTRLASATQARVQHRWTQDGRVRQDVTLSIGANPSAGYRTFSRQTLTPGQWRVELRTAGGALLHEVSFEVR